MIFPLACVKEMAAKDSAVHGHPEIKNDLKR